MGRYFNRTNLWFHFAQHHTHDTIVILKEGNRPYPRCPQCNMFVLHKDLNKSHMTTTFFQLVAKIKRHILDEEESRVGAETALKAYGTPLALVTSFNYLGRILTAADEKWSAVASNLRKARRKWARLTRVMGK